MWVVKFLFFLFALYSCVTTTQDRVYELHPVTVAMLENFNQTAPSRSGTKNWLGDWIFRRDRLELIDKNLRNVKPDIFVLQNAVEKYQSFAESDVNILLAGSLRDYVSMRMEALKIDLTNETSGVGFIVAPPLKFLPTAIAARKSWKLSMDGFLAVVDISDGTDVTTLFSLQMPKKNDEAELWFDFSAQKILEYFAHPGIEKSACAEKAIIAGHISSESDQKNYEKFLSRIGFKDTSTGFCENAGKCQTATSLNELFMVTHVDDAPAQLDRIMVHRSAIVYSSARAFTEGLETEKYKEEYGLNRLLPSTHYGWTSQVRLKKCK